MLQIVDISQTLLLNEKIFENEMLEIMNASTSHELRNPLNSMIAQGIKGDALFKKIKEISQYNGYDEITSIVTELESGSKI